MRFREIAVSAALALSVFASADKYRNLGPGEMRGIRIWNSGQHAFKVHRDTGVVDFTWSISFKNETKREIHSFTVRLSAFHDGRPFWHSREATISQFSNLSVPHVGSLLPFEKSDYALVNFPAPMDIWRTDTEFRAELLGGTTWVSPDIHDTGHLYSKLYGLTQTDQYALLKKDPSLLKVREANGLTGTLVVFGCCGPAVVKFVKEHGGNLHDQTKGGSSFMHLAAVNGYGGVLDFGVQWGGNVNVKTKNGRTPLDKAIIRGNLPAWQWLLKHGARPHDAVGGESTAWYAIDAGQREALQDMVRAGLSPRMHDRLGWGLMHYAVGNAVLMDTVLALGAPVDDRNPKSGITPLMNAESRGYPDAAWWPLKHGANTELKDRSGKTAYDYARTSNTLRTDRFFRDMIREARGN